MSRDSALWKLLSDAVCRLMSECGYCRARVAVWESKPCSGEHQGPWVEVRR